MYNDVLSIEDSNTKYSDAFGCERLEFNNQSTDDQIHAWLLINKSAFKNIKKMIIPIRLGKEDSVYMGLYIGMHIRLTKELGDARFSPIAFVFESTREEILFNQIENHSEKTGLLLFTKAVKIYSSFNLESDFLEKNHSPTNDIFFKEELKSKLSFKTPEKGHDLANEWGAFRLAKYAGAVLKTNKPNSLFFKYKDYLSNNELINVSKILKSSYDFGINALLIDDHADSGWSECLEFILNNNIQNPKGEIRSLVTIKTNKEAQAITDYEKYDIIFLDLRLLPSEDKSDQILTIDNFSGAKLLKQIKEQNKGIQVIVFTASNKVWNIQQLLDIGANGYYIKESPEYILNEKFSNDNFNSLLKNIIECLQAGYQRRIWKTHKKCLDFITNDSKTRSDYDYNQFYLRTIAALELSFDLLSKSRTNPKHLNFAYLIYYQICEDYASQLANIELKSESECYVYGPNKTKRVITNSGGNISWELKFDTYYYKKGKWAPSPKANRQSALVKISFLLAFKFNKDDAFLKQWGDLNNLRNTKAAHLGVYIIDVKEIFQIVELVELFLTNK